MSATSEEYWTMDSLDTLIARLEAALAGSQTIDDAIFDWLLALNPRPPIKWALFSRSLDAARTLVPEGQPVELDMRPSAKSFALIGEWSGEYDDDGLPTPYYGGDLYWAFTPALALCIAALKARQPQARQDAPVSPQDGRGCVSRAEGENSP